MERCVLITPQGFREDTWQNQPVLDADALADAPVGAVGEGLRLRLSNEARVEQLAPHLHRLDGIAITFPKVEDGRGFSLARQLREMGFEGELRAEGELHADQVRHILLSGFDTIAVPAARAERIPERVWLGEAETMLPSYQRRFETGA